MSPDEIVRAGMFTTDPISEKASRLTTGEPLRVLDLFAGCGGFSLGFQAAGFQILGAVESDAQAANTHALNLKTRCKPTDISTDPIEFVKSLDGGPPEEAVDVIIGGPPCQTFARVGRAKLRAESQRQSCWEKRAGLYRRYLDYVQALKPLVIVFENVPDILSYDGRNVAADICDQLRDLGYSATCTLLNAAHLGVPQFRERLYLMAFHNSLNRTINWPSQTHQCELPAGYRGIRAYARRQNRGVPNASDPLGGLRTLEDTCLQAVTVHEALADLPPIFAVQRLAEGKLNRLAQRLSVQERYPAEQIGSQFAYQMRNWTGYESSETVTAHVIRRLPRDYRIFAEMQPGDQYPRAYSIGNALFQQALDEYEEKGDSIEFGSERYNFLKKEWVPPYCPNKFPNKWRKLEPDMPSRTLMAHLSHDSYSHIHYDSRQARTISVREAARLQSFPDGFTFTCSMNDAFKQIGNAVPPLVSYALAREIGASLGKRVGPDIRCPVKVFTTN